jgi:NADPH:quinone reductase-like Zn-dependent oxidoreductase
MSGSVGSERRMMRAVVCERYGPPEVLRQVEMERPEPREGEVLVRVHATTVTPADLRVRGFDVPPSFWLPARLALGLTRPKQPVLGRELAGTIEAVGGGVSRFSAGDRVFALTGHDGGAYSEFVRLREDGVVAKKPVGLTFAEAACLPMGCLTSKLFLDRAGVGKGDRVLIYGASGSLGTYAVQLAKGSGAEVTAVCSAKNLAMVLDLGADRAVDYTREDFTEACRYDVVFDTVGKASYSACARSLRPGGTYLHAVGTPGAKLRMRLAVLGGGKKTVGGSMLPTGKDLEEVRRMAEAGVVRPVIDRTYTLDEIVEAHRYAGGGHKRGNVPVIVHSA